MSTVTAVKSTAESATVDAVAFDASTYKSPAAALRGLAKSIESIKLPAFDAAPFNSIPEAYRAVALEAARKAFAEEHGDGAATIRDALNEGFRDIFGAFNLSASRGGAGRQPLPRWEELSLKQQEDARALAKSGKDVEYIAATIGKVHLASLAKALKDVLA